MPIKQVNLRLDTELFKEVKHRAIFHEITLTEWIMIAITERIERENATR